MNEDERFETGLRRVTPAPVPPQLLELLRATPLEKPSPGATAPRPGFIWPAWRRGWRLWALGTAAVAAVVLCFTARPPGGSQADARELKPSAVEVGHSLVASFDTVQRLPGGEPVRFRCREWQDRVVIRDAAHGMVISQTVPRVEVIPVRFEIY